MKSLRVSALVAAALLIAWGWRQWRQSGDVGRRLLDAKSADSPSPFVWQPYLIPLALIFAATLASAMMSLAPEFSLKQIRKQLLLYMIIFAIVWNITRWGGLQGVWRIMWCMAWSGAVSAVLGLYGYLSGSMMEMGRATGTLESYTRSAMFFAMHLPLTLALLLEQRRRRAWHRVLFLVAIMGVSLLFVLVSQTRGVWISVAIVFFLMALLARRWIAVGILIGGAVIMFAVSPSLQMRLQTFVTHWGEWNDLSSGRMDIWRNGWMAIEAHPWFGVGYGPDIFQQAPVRELHSIDNYKKQPDLHQLYMQQLAEVGIVGIAAYLIFSGVLLWQTTRHFLPRLGRSCREGNAGAQGLGLAALGIWGALASIMIYGLIGNFYENHNAWVFWAMIGLAAGVASLPVASEVEPSHDRQSSPADAPALPY